MLLLGIGLAGLVGATIGTRKNQSPPVLEGREMASNFKILRNQSGNNLHLKLIGGFDGTSAFELLNTITDLDRHEEKIIIHTDGLNYIDPFGKELFVKKIQGAGRLNLVFTGRYADTFF